MIANISNNPRRGQGEQAEDLRISEASADRNTEAYGGYRFGLPGRSAPLVGKPPGGMPEKDLNTIVGAPSGAPQFIPSRYLWLSFYP